MKNTTREGIIKGTLARVNVIPRQASGYTRYIKRGRYSADFERVEFCPTDEEFRIDILVKDAPECMPSVVMSGRMLTFVLPSVTSLFNNSEHISYAVTDDIYAYVVINDDPDPDRAVCGKVTGWWRHLSAEVLRKRRLAAAAVDNGYALY